MIFIILFDTIKKSHNFNYAKIVRKNFSLKKKIVFFFKVSSSGLLTLVTSGRTTIWNQPRTAHPPRSSAAGGCWASPAGIQKWRRRQDSTNPSRLRVRLSSILPNERCRERWGGRCRRWKKLCPSPETLARSAVVHRRRRRRRRRTQRCRISRSSPGLRSPKRRLLRQRPIVYISCIFPESLDSGSCIFHCLKFFRWLSFWNKNLKFNKRSYACG